MNWQIIVGALFLLTGITQIFEDFGNALFTIAIGIGLLYWGLKKKGRIKASSKPSPETRTLTEENFRAVGVNYYEGNIRKLAYKNPDWQLSSEKIIESGKAGQQIFRHNFVNRPVKLNPQPDNEHDPNAIAVIIAGELTGYISKEDNLHVKNILETKEIKSLSAFIGGGECKVVSEDKTVTKSKYSFSVNVRIKYI